MNTAQTVAVIIGGVSLFLGVVYVLVSILSRSVDRLGEQVGLRVADMSAQLGLRIDAVGARIDDLGGRINRVEDRLTLLSSEVTAVFQVQARHGVLLEQVIADVGKIGEKLDEHINDPHAHEVA